MLNALMIDVEEYFQVTAFAHHIHPSDWDRYRWRVENNTNRLLDILAERNIHATFFIIGWIAERVSGRGHADRPAAACDWLLQLFTSSYLR